MIKLWMTVKRSPSEVWCKVEVHKGAILRPCELVGNLTRKPCFDVEVRILNHLSRHARVSFDLVSRNDFLAEFWRVGFAALSAFTNPAGCCFVVINQDVN